MSLFSAAERRFGQAVGCLTYCNPFLPERAEYEKAALEKDFVPVDMVWNKLGVTDREVNVIKIRERTEALAEKTRGRIADGAALSDEDATVYDDLVIFLLFHRYQPGLWEILFEALALENEPGEVTLYDRFLKDYRHFYGPINERTAVRKGGKDAPAGDRTSWEPAHLFASFFQVRRAFHHIFGCIVGESMTAARLRAAVWQSIFTHDMRRYRRVLYNTMGDITCLVTGPSGTGKELVARAIGLSRYIPFDTKTKRFTEDFIGSFYPLNLSALSPTLIESELFGHKRGAFTGAISDHKGWFEVCPPLGAVFLDEIAEVDSTIQVKLLRVIETRNFQRIGESKTRFFRGKSIAATNRDLGEAMRAGRFREDLYYRLCSDWIVTPSLREHLAEGPDVLRNLVRHIAGRFVGEEEAEPLAEEATRWIKENLGESYPWPGNFRELEQCIRNILIRQTYKPIEVHTHKAREDFARSVAEGSFDAEELLRRYCTLVYADTGSYQATARRLGLDHRTVKSRIDLEWLEELNRS